MTIKLSAIQLNSKANVEYNLEVIECQLQTLKCLSSVNSKSIEHIVVLPECCLFFGANDKAQLQLARQSEIANGLINSLSCLAKKYKITLIGGSIPILTDDGKKYTNSSCAFNSKGNLIGRYDKIHLFDVNIEDSEKNYCESRYTQAGTQSLVVNTPCGGLDISIGLSICFDLRFPKLYQQLAAMGANIITVPSAFTRVTGKAHWQTLLQARAIENQVYIVAAGQEGIHENGRETWGHSMIISPWGEIISTIEKGEGIITSDFIPQEINRIRASMPLKHNAETLS